MKIIATIEARMSSSRLPGKVLMEAAGTPMLYHLLKRLSKAQFIDDFIIATTDNPKDDEKSLSERVKKLEHQLYPEVIDAFVAGEFN